MPEPKHMPKEVQPPQSTPGPWTLQKNGAYSREIAIVQWCGDTENAEGDSMYWCSILGSRLPKNPVENKANAVLIAAAPELRDRLETLVEHLKYTWGDVSDEWRDAKALLTRLRNAGT